MSAVVRTGYKHTDVGMIPEDWAVDSIDSVPTRGGRNGIVDGPFGSNLKTIHYRKSGIPIITSGYVTDGSFFAGSYLYVDKEKFEQEKRSAVGGGDIVMAKIGARCGASAILPESHVVGILSGNALKITVDQKRHSNFYVWQVLWDLYTSNRIDILRTVGAQPAISMANLKKFKIPLPPLPEQRAIATALSDVDALLAKLDALVAKKRDLKVAAMQQLLTGQTRLPGFSGEWEVKRLGQISPLQRGFDLLTSRLRTGPYPVVYSNGVSSYHDDFMVKGPGVITGRSGTIGNVHFVEGDFWPHNTSLWVTNFKGNSPKFVFYLLSSLELERLGTGSGVPTLNRNDVHAQNVSIPPMAEEQTAIATVLSDMDAELTALEARRDKTRALKQGMMQELLTGKIRLV